MSRRTMQIGLLALLLASAAGVAAYYFWSKPHPLPGPDSPVYVEYLRAFQVGVASLDSAIEDDRGRKRLEHAVALIPQEPAGWANLGLLHLRKNELDDAARQLKRAHQLAPESAEVEALLGLLADKQGRVADAVAHLRKAVEKRPHDLASIYKLATIVSAGGGADSQAEYQRLVEQILAADPNNLPMLVQRARTAFGRKDKAALQDTLERLERLASDWTPEAREQLVVVRTALAASSQDALLDLTRLGNVLQGVRGFSRDARVVNLGSGKAEGTPLTTFLRLQPARPAPAPPDRDLAFAVEPQPAPDVEAMRCDVIRPMWMLGEAQRTEVIDGANKGGTDSALRDPLKLSFLVANGKVVRRIGVKGSALPFPGGPKEVAPSDAGVLAVDFDNDYRVDLVLAGAGGLRFWQGQADGAFIDVTNKTKLDNEILSGDYWGVWPADLEADGDLDLIVARRTGPPLVLRNNGDRTFRIVKTFADITDVRSFVWADLDNDGAADAAFLDARGKLHVFSNERYGQFKSWPVRKDMGAVIAMTAADLNDDGVFDLVVLHADGAVVRLSDQGQKKSWNIAELGRCPAHVDAAPGAAAIFAGDLDNNGAIDLIVAGPKTSHVFLADKSNTYLLLPGAIPLHGQALLDLNHDGRLDLLGVSADGNLGRALNKSKNNYGWQTLWPLANPKAGDGRINSFAIGGEVEVRSGLLVQKQLITGGAVHFGLGNQIAADIARIVWPNGLPQWEFDTPTGQVCTAVQRLGGSCPFLFTWDGEGIRFSGDFMWGTPLGMYINGQNIGDFPQTTEWLKIPGKHLKPRAGYYDVRVHANLWEADYFDQLALIVVDHPPDTEIHVDERFFLTPTKPHFYLTTPTRPVARAWDHQGGDVTDLVKAIDGRYVDRAGRGRFQGVTNDHWVEVDLGDDVPREGPLLLVARGWLHPTNSSINVALAQGKHDMPRPLSLEVPDGKGGWKVALPALGFPAGKDKTMLIRLDGIDGKGVPRRFRLRTNMEIYWDFLGTARELDPNLAQLRRPAPTSAELRFRGVLTMTRQNESSPEVPIYDKVIRGGQPWRDLEGYYTRFGDVRELLEKVDDRYVIANAGDEIAFRFAVPEGPKAGWLRDFIWECDGWTRDGDFNTRHGNSVLPLPAHNLKMDTRPPGRLQDDPVYRRFPLDWRNYHTRYVTPDDFARGLRSFRRK